MPPMDPCSDNNESTVANGTSSRNDIDDIGDLNLEVGLQTDVEDYEDNLNWTTAESQAYSSGQKDTSRSKLNESIEELGSRSPDTPLICETINDFCARHSREEMEFLISQIGFLKISDCYFSEKRSTLCTVIELKRNAQN